MADQHPEDPEVPEGPPPRRFHLADPDHEADAGTEPGPTPFMGSLDVYNLPRNDPSLWGRRKRGRRSPPTE